jgi:hypothetical protein
VIPDKVLAPLIENSPIGIMARGTLEYALNPADVDTLFGANAENQYTRTLLFSTVVDLMSLVVHRIRPSLHAAYQSNRHRIEVSVQSMCNKVDGIEPTVSAALVKHVAGRTAPIIENMKDALPELLPGYRARNLDGNHLAATERRIAELCRTAAGPLPGFALVVLDPRLIQVKDAIPCEDGHAQERSQTDAVLAKVEPRDLWIADRNLCTNGLLFGIARREGFIVVRHHRINVPWQPTGHLRRCGTIDGSEVWEEQVKLRDDAGNSLIARRVTLKLEKPTRDGDTELHILTNPPPEDVPGARVGTLYRNRWGIKLAFQELEATLEGELNTLGYPKAALFAFCVALVAYNILSILKAALRAEHGSQRIEEEVSTFYLADEIAGTRRGMDSAIPAKAWRVFQTAQTENMEKVLVDLAAKVDLPKFRRHPRGPKKPHPPRSFNKKHPHVSTARLLALRKTKRNEAS